MRSGSTTACVKACEVKTQLEVLGINRPNQSSKHSYHPRLPKLKTSEVEASQLAGHVYEKIMCCMLREMDT